MKEALKLALESMKRIDAWLIQRGYTGLMPQEKEVITSIESALAQPEHEFVAKNEGGRITWLVDNWPQNCLLYTTPPQRKPLTDEEIADLWSAQIFHINDLKLAKDFVRDIEAAHGIKE